MSTSGRTVHALVTRGHRLLGALPPFEVESPWWPDAEPVNLHLKHVLGVDTYVLRLVSASGTAPRDGEVTYHVEVTADPTRQQLWCPVEPELAELLLAPQALRRPWAKPGGPSADLRWADAVLIAAGRPRIGPAVQVKTWNLSCVQRLPTVAGNVWLKTTGAEQTREELSMAVVARFDPALVPTVVGADPVGCRVLCDEVPGRDLPDAPLDLVLSTIERWVAVQAAIAAQDTKEITTAGLRAERLEELANRVADLLAGPKTSGLSSSERRGVAAIVRDLPARVARLTATGLPTTLVHGDFISLNWRGSDCGVRLIDWADSYVGHPAHDLLVLLSRLPQPWHDEATNAWCAAWERLGPPCDPAAAVSLARPMVSMRSALVYADFLDAIEPSEWCYHEDDPVAQLRLALEMRDGD